jgi:hypothetical protein
MENTNNTGKGRTAIYVAAILGTFLLVAFLVWQMVKVAQPSPVNADRARARAKDNTEIRAAGATALTSWGHVDAPPTARPNGFVRMPVEEAMKLTVQGYQKPDAFRSDLMARVEKANAPAKNPYE